MKVWGLWATLGFAILAFVLGQALGFAVTLSMVKNFAQATAERKGSCLSRSVHDFPPSRLTVTPPSLAAIMRLVFFGSIHIP